MNLKVGKFIVRYSDGSEVMFYGIYNVSARIGFNKDWEVDIVLTGAVIIGSRQSIDKTCATV